MKKEEKKESTPAKQAGTQPKRGDLREQRDGMQEDQVVGETSRGAANKEARNRKPSGKNEGKMSKQQSQKRGIRSDAQKQTRAREGYDPIPPSKPVAGAFGEQQGAQQSDQDLALQVDEKTRRREEAAESD